MENQLIKRALLEKSQRVASEATELFNATQVEVNKERIVAGERVGWFCAGAISLSFTLIGYLFSNPQAKIVLTMDIYYKVPSIAILVLGWVCLMLSIMASLLIRMWNSAYLNYNKAEHWTAANKESKEKAIEAIEAGVPMLFVDATNTQQAMDNVKESRDNYTDLEESFKWRAKFWLRSCNLAQATIYVGAIGGFMFLTVFLILVTYKLIYS